MVKFLGFVLAAALLVQSTAQAVEIMSCTESKVVNGTSQPTGADIYQDIQNEVRDFYSQLGDKRAEAISALASTIAQNSATCDNAASSLSEIDQNFLVLFKIRNK